MRIGIDASRAFQKNRTGIEEYSYRVIKYLRTELDEPQVFLYLKINQKVDFTLPDNWKIKVIKFPYLWSQAGLSLELLFHSVDKLFVPSHVVPLIHPADTTVTVHGLEYEFCPEAYSLWERFYMRWSIKKSCQWAKKIITVSQSTKRDLMRMYKVPENKIEVIYEGVGSNFQLSIFNPPAGEAGFQSIFNDKIKKPYILFIGRLEERKNIAGIIKAFEVLKENHKIPHQLVLAGKRGHNYESIQLLIEGSRWKDEIVETGFISEEKKWKILKNADVFLFPTFYEGFGLPVLEAQSAGVPVVASDNSSIPEITKYENSKDNSKSAILVNPSDFSEIAEAAYKLISDKAIRDDIIEKGYKNVKRFNWEKCSREIASCLAV